MRFPNKTESVLLVRSNVSVCLLLISAHSDCKSAHAVLYRFRSLAQSTPITITLNSILDPYLHTITNVLSRKTHTYQSTFFREGNLLSAAIVSPYCSFGNFASPIVVPKSLLTKQSPKLLAFDHEISLSD